MEVLVAFAWGTVAVGGAIKFIESVRRLMGHKTPKPDPLDRAAVDLAARMLTPPSSPAKQLADPSGDELAEDLSDESPVKPQPKPVELVSPKSPPPPDSPSPDKS